MADTYKPTSAMASAAKRALKWKEDGKATGAGTAVGWTRARQLANGEALSLDTVKRMYSFFSRHEVDKKGKGFYDGPEFPSNGRIMWDAWGGDAGFSWSRAIVNRENKSTNKMDDYAHLSEEELYMDLEKKDYTAAQRKRMAQNGEAMDDGSFPIANANDLRNAIQSVGRAADYEAAKRHIMRRAKALRREDLLPEDWKKSVKKSWNGFFGG
jgi:hypothetical protein